jgi:thiamine kinase-like enzyme
VSAALESGHARASAVTADLWPGEPAVIEAISGGITNENFKVTVGQDSYVIRVFGRNAEMLLIDRALECEITSVAAQIGVGPELIATQIDRGVLVTRFIPGATISAADLQDREMLRRVAVTLRKVHSVSAAVLGNLDPFRDIRYYAGELSQRNLAVDPAYSAGIALAAEIEGLVHYQQHGLCHGDLLSANFVQSEQGIFIVDWEYAGLGDPLFDLANLSINHSFSPEQDALLLEYYQGGASEHELAKIRALRFISALREAGWSYLQMAISALEVDFGAYADACLQKMRESSGEIQFADALATLRKDGSLPERRDRPSR